MQMDVGGSGSGQEALEHAQLHPVVRDVVTAAQQLHGLCLRGSADPSAAQPGGVSRGYVDKVTITAEASEVKQGTRRCQCMPDTAKVRGPGLPLSKLASLHR